MIDLGANPYIRNVDNITHYEVVYLSDINNLPQVKSVFFPIKSFPTAKLGEPWCYTTGVYDGKFGRVIGKGGEGMVIQGEWNGQAAAYKFVKMKSLERHGDPGTYNMKNCTIELYNDEMADMNERLNEMTEMMATPGDAILSFEAHFR